VSKGSREEERERGEKGERKEGRKKTLYQSFPKLLRLGVGSVKPDLQFFKNPKLKTYLSDTEGKF
jgi:hypothetical protein